MWVPDGKRLPLNCMPVLTQQNRKNNPNASLFAKWCTFFVTTWSKNWQPVVARIQSLFAERPFGSWKSQQLSGNNKCVSVVETSTDCVLLATILPDDILCNVLFVASPSSLSNITSPPRWVDAEHEAWACASYVLARDCWPPSDVRRIPDATHDLRSRCGRMFAAKCRLLLSLLLLQPLNFLPGRINANFRTEDAQCCVKSISCLKHFLID